LSSSPRTSFTSEQSFHDAVGGEYELDGDGTDGEVSSNDESDSTVGDSEDDSTPAAADSEASTGRGSDHEARRMSEGDAHKGPSSSDATAVARRQTLPAPASTNQVGIFSLLTSLKGKDLSRVSMPVTFNEPLSALQRLAEDFEYSDLLSRAADSDDAIERLSFVAAFFVSGFAATRMRHSRKPLWVSKNPAFIYFCRP
jgi:hypothetical protein